MMIPLQNELIVAVKAKKATPFESGSFFIYSQIKVKM